MPVNSVFAKYAGRVPGLHQRTTVRYLLATGLSVSVTLAIPVLLVELAGITPRVASAFAFSLALVVNFVTLKFYVYRSEGRWQSQVVKYLITGALFRATEYAAFLVLHDGFGIFYALALVVVVGVSFVAKFFIYQVVIFTRPKDQNELQ
ncbi:GtrA family protein [Denitrobaculum tricleocarpae]|uniref:GtrA/DPMS transmembrane domain-containing protein n=1 Tax=Denitrobaculum tricleocarpae TaxID=2591009 RepID=A0A545TGA8_9PROT|nr:GtrA family protein [Denitrobaculum tricleocarpae]TQV76259.1 hypothetical protein FKG95_21750 [Denitrobaculum tricleocarpae]